MRLSCNLIVFFVLVLQQANCQYTSSICDYKQSAFDSDTCCWRELLKKDSFDKAGDLIVTYLACHSPKKNTHSLRWHAGQAYAFAGDNRKAKHYFRKTYNVFTKWFGGKDGKAWYYYSKGTVAFIARRKKKLNRIISKWDRKLPKDINYKALVKLYSDFDKSYLNASR